MRNIILLFVFINITGFCQNPTGYYPLEIGNVWEYWDPWDSLFIERDIVLKDTTFSNNLVYKLIQTTYSFGNQDTVFRRQNYGIVYQYDLFADSERVIYDFNKTLGDTLWIMYFPFDTVIYRITMDGYDYFYGKLLRHIDYYTESTASSFYNIDRIVDSIGLIYNEHEPGIGFSLRGAKINGIQYGMITSVENDKTNPENFILYQNYPNPFNSLTKIGFIIPKRVFVSLKVYDILGRVIKTLVNEEKEPGDYRVSFNNSNLSGGVYFYIIHAGDYKETKKMIFLP